MTKMKEYFDKLLVFLKNVKKETWIRLIIYVSIVLFGFVLDRVTKTIVSNNLVLGEKKQIEIIPDFLYLAYVRNTGGAWSILSGATWLLTLFSAFAVVVVSYYIFKKNVNNVYMILGALIVSGGLGNFYDRIVYSAVIDFIESYPFGYAFPIFNVADIFVVIGSFSIIGYSYYEDFKKKKESGTKILTEEELALKDDQNEGNK